MSNNKNDKIGVFWSSVRNSSPKSRWWQSEYIRSKINFGLGKFQSKEISYAMTGLVKKYTGNRVFTNGISVGAGNGHKEMNLIKNGLVKNFKLYELSEVRIKDGLELAKRLNLQENVQFIHGDAFELELTESSFDIVHWNNSLHHMFDTNKAVKWSRNVLKNNGLFYMDDYVGPNRFQWNSTMMSVCNKIRSVLPDHYFINHEGKKIEQNLYKPDFIEMMEKDPSEAPDSENIVPSIEKHFPDAIINYTGGVVYHLALKDIIYGIEKYEDYHIIDILFIIDDLLSKMGENHYATAFALK